MRRQRYNYIKVRVLPVQNYIRNAGIVEIFLTDSIEAQNQKAEFGRFSWDL